MIVKELREIVNKIPLSCDNSIILMQEDDEGNGYRNINGIDTETMAIEDDRDIQVYPNSFKTKYFENKREFAELRASCVDCVVIY